MTQMARHPDTMRTGALAEGPAEEKRFLGGITALLVTVFLLLGFSRAPDLLLPQWPLLFAISLTALAFTVVNGSAFPAIGSRLGVRLVLFAAWICLASVFGIWPGGSVGIINDQLLRSVMAYVLVAASLRTVAQCRNAMIATGIGSVIAALFAFYHDARRMGRLVLPVGLYSNPNDFAAALLLGVPLLWCLTAFSHRAPLSKKLLVGAGTGASLFAVSLTGSRGAFIALGVVALGLFFMARFATRTMIVIAAVVGLVSAPVWLPESVAVRLGLEVEDEDLGPEEAFERERIAAEGSASQRTRLLEQSLQLTLRNPVFGVGAGNFEVASAELSRSEGEKPIWLGTHNTYTQISSEAGIPALAFYLSALFGALRDIFALRRKALALPGQARVARLSSALLLSLLSLSVTSFFGSVAYHWLFPVLLGFTVALTGAFEREAPDLSPEVAA